MNKRLSKPYIILIAVVVLFFAFQFGRAVGAANVEPIYVPVLETITEYVDKPIEFEKLIYIPAETQAVEFTVTAYCTENYPHICNDGDATQTATGTTPTPGRTIAVDQKVISYGTSVYIDGLGVFVAEDCGGGVKGNHIDVVYPTHADALQFGVQTLKVWILS